MNQRVGISLECTKETYFERIQSKEKLYLTYPRCQPDRGLENRKKESINVHSRWCSSPNVQELSVGEQAHGSLCWPVYSKGFHWNCGKDSIAVVSGAMHQRRGRSPAQEGRSTCFCEMKFYPSWIKPLSHGVSSQNLPPVSTHRKNRYRYVQNMHLERNDFSFNLGSKANLYSG